MSYSALSSCVARELAAGMAAGVSANRVKKLQSGGDQAFRKCIGHLTHQVIAETRELISHSSLKSIGGSDNDFRIFDCYPLVVILP